LLEEEKHFKEDFTKKIKNINIEDFIFTNGVLRCIAKFLDSEIDYITPGIRGLGRMSTYWPRFGGYYTKFLSKLNQKDIEIIKNTINDIIIFGYYSSVVQEVYKNKISNFDQKTFESLYQEWIPIIYAERFSESVNNYLNDRGIISYYYFCIKLLTETDFPKNVILRKGIGSKGNLKLASIMRKYIDAGFILRAIESGWAKKI